MNDRGFSLVELIAAMVVGALVAGAGVRTLSLHRRFSAERDHRIQTNRTLREAAAVLAAELRGLGPGREGGDLVEMTPFRIRYRPLRNLYVVCRRADVANAAVILHAERYGLRSLDPRTDSILVWVAPKGPGPGTWLHGDLASAGGGVKCPGGAPGVRAVVRGVARPDLARVMPGDPARTGEIVELRAYRGGRGDWWLGMRRIPKQGAGSPIQPLLGPLARAGLRILYRDRSGRPTSDPAAVALIEFRISPAGRRGVRDPSEPYVIRVGLRAGP